MTTSTRLQVLGIGTPCLHPRLRPSYHVHAQVLEAHTLKRWEVVGNAIPQHLTFALNIHVPTFIREIELSQDMKLFISARYNFMDVACVHLQMLPTALAPYSPGPT
jgi:hypothetical protein